MRTSIAALLCALAMSSFSPTASAELLVGRLSGTAGVHPQNAISLFSDAADGDVAPIALIGGDASLLDMPYDIIHDAEAQAFVVADFRNQNIQVYALSARGNVAPLRRFSSPSMGQPRDIAVIDGVNEYAVITRSLAISYYPRDANGSVSAIRSTALSAGGIDNASGLIYLPASDEVVVGDVFLGTDGANHGELLFFARTASGNAVPTRRIAGAQTLLGSYVYDIAHDRATAELHVLVGDTQPNGQTINRIVVFAAGANGNTAPIRQINGPQTQLVSASRMHFDAERNELLVNAGANAGTPAIIAFSRNAQGDTPPQRRISGPNTGVTTIPGFGPIFSYSTNLLLRDGFE